MISDQLLSPATTKNTNNINLRLIKTQNLSQKILIIDDDLDLASAMKFVIESYRTSKCDILSDPYEALLAISDNSYDYIFIDEKIPGLKGSSILKMLDEQISNDPLIIESGRFNEKKPVILMSGSDIKLENNFSLKNFELIKVLKKIDLPLFLSLNFSN